MPDTPRSSPGNQRRFRPGRRLAAVLLAAAFAVAACGDDGGGETAAPISSDVLAEGTFEGSGVTVQGETFDLGQLANTDLILWFWSPW